MKLRTYVFIFLSALAGSAFLASCLNEENKIPENCYDGALNNLENPEGYKLNGALMFDCGGPNCEPCDHCANMVYEPWLDEEWRDCGGECAPCTQCNNGIKDGDEEAVDCGGSNCPICETLCGDGLLNGYEIQIDCIDGTDLTAHGCNACPTCDDQIFNGLELGIDCGGPNCPPCCATGNCGNGVQDINEFNADCGGLTCEDCKNAIQWNIDGDDFSTPTLAVVTTFADPVINFLQCPAFEDPEYTIILGKISLVITGPFIIDSPLPQVFNFAESTDYAIVFEDETGEIYSTSTTGGSGTIVLTKVDQAIVPDSDLDECNKPAGTYNYYRGSFHGTLTSSSIDLLPKECESGSFQVTFYTP